MLIGGGGNLYTFIKEPFISGCSFGVNDAIWFVMMLFFVSVLYSFFHRATRKNNVIMLLFSLFLILMGFMSVMASSKGMNTTKWALLPLKIAFYMPFYNWGHVYKQCFEQYISRVHPLKACFGCLIVSGALVSIYGYEVISFSSTAFMGSFTAPHYILPYVTSFIGILFWIKVAEILEKSLGNNNFIALVADNSFFIMANHLLLANIPNFICLFFYKHDKLANFDVERFMSSPWYLYNSRIYIWNFVCGMLGCILLIILINKFKKLKRVREM